MLNSPREREREEHLGRLNFWSLRSRLSVVEPKTYRARSEVVTENDKEQLCKRERRTHLASYRFAVEAPSQPQLMNETSQLLRPPTLRQETSWTKQMLPLLNQYTPADRPLEVDDSVEKGKS